MSDFRRWTETTYERHESSQHVADSYFNVERQESLQHIADPYFNVEVSTHSMFAAPRSDGRFKRDPVWLWYTKKGEAFVCIYIYIYIHIYTTTTTTNHNNTCSNNDNDKH